MSARFIVGDVFDGLATLEAGSVDLVVTSPPFLALRSYLPADHPDKGREIGSEATPAAFLDVMLAFTAELRRVVAPHGSICIELGDTYAGQFGEGHARQDGGRYPEGGAVSRPNQEPAFNIRPGRSPNGWPLAKSKTLIPELFRIALAYGINPLTGEPSPAGQWRVRNVVTWARPNPPVGALGDKWRPATSDVVVACVSGKRYWDDLATRKAQTKENGGSRASLNRGNPGFHTGDDETACNLNASGAPLLDYWEIPLLDGEEPTRYGPTPPAPRPYRTGPETAYKPDPVLSGDDRRTGGQHPAGSPLLDYWVIPPGGYEGSHYAVFPPELVVPLVKAMTPERVCRECGEPSRRITETQSFADGLPSDGTYVGRRDRTDGIREGEKIRATFSMTAKTLGWTDCGHDNWRPGLVLDPFCGSGTTLLVATGHGHDAIGIDLDARNAELALQRVGPFLLDVEVTK